MANGARLASIAKVMTLGFRNRLIMPSIIG